MTGGVNCDWIVIKNVPGGFEMSCKRCGSEYTPTVPCPIEVFLACAKAYGALHARCAAGVGKKRGGKA